MFQSAPRTGGDAACTLARQWLIVSIRAPARGATGAAGVTRRS